MSKEQPAPRGLGKSGRNLWQSVTAEYTLNAAGLKILESACRQADMLATLEEESRNIDLTARGSQGQPVIHPIIAEARQARSQLNILLKSLKLDSADEEGEGGKMDTSEAGRKAARARFENRIKGVA